MKTATYFREQLLQFPWSRLEKDNSFNWDVVKTRLGILGEGLRFGYWSHPYGHRTHDESPTEIEETTGLPAEPTGPRGSPDYMHGQVMLNAAWSLSRIDRQWKLSDRTQIPTLFFADERDAPSRPEPGEVKDWETWYKWRGLPLSSPVALLMDRVLSVYHILVNVLRVVDVKQVGGSSPTVITVHYLGGEVELNFIPLYLSRPLSSLKKCTTHGTPSFPFEQILGNSTSPARHSHRSDRLRQGRLRPRAQSPTKNWPRLRPLKLSLHKTSFGLTPLL